MEHSRGGLIVKGAELLLKDVVRKTHLRQHPEVEPSDAQYGIDDDAVVALLLERSAPDRLAKTPKANLEGYPSVAELYTFIASRSQPVWEQIYKLADARSGDIFVWKQSITRTAARPDASRCRARRISTTLRTRGPSAVRIQAHFDESRGRGTTDGARRPTLGRQVGPHSRFQPSDRDRSLSML